MAEILLSCGLVTLVDDDDVHLLGHHSWQVDQIHGYVYRVRTRVPRRIQLHLLIHPSPVGYVTDHVNNNRLDNRRENLQTITQAQNGLKQPVRRHNTTGYAGVSRRENGRFQAKIAGICLGTYDTAEEASERVELMRDILLEGVRR